MQNLTYRNSNQNKKKIVNCVSLVTLIFPPLKQTWQLAAMTVIDLSGNVNWEQSEKENGDERDAYNF